jgi:hypothetical protein
MMGNRLVWIIDLKSLGRFDRAGSNPALGTDNTKGLSEIGVTPFTLLFSSEGFGTLHPMQKQLEANKRGYKLA